MMADFVNEDVPDQLFDSDFAIVDPLGEHRLPVEMHMVGTMGNVIDRKARDVDAFIEPCQLEWILNPEIKKDVIICEVSDMNDDIAA